MDKEKNSIVVPFDFSEKAQIAIQHAVQIGQVMDKHIYLAYFNEDAGIFANKVKILKQEEMIRQQLSEVVENLKNKYNFPFQFVVKSGKAKNTLKSLVEEVKASLLITGINYETKGCFINAIDYIGFLREVNVPVIVTNQPPRNKNYREIVVPLEWDKKYKEEVKWVIYFANHYKCNINLIRPNFQDAIKKKYVDNIIFFSKKMLDSNNIVYG